MYTAGNSPISPNRTNQDQSNTASKIDAGAQNDIYGFFRKGIDRRTIDASFAPTFFQPIAQEVGDLGRLERYQKLKSLVEPAHLDKIKLHLKSDYSANTWCYRFSFDGSDLFSSEARIMGHGQDLIAYQNEYFLQAFPSTVNVQFVKTLLQKVRDIDVTTLKHQRAALDSFLDLTDMVAGKDVERFVRRAALDRSKNQWTYEFLIDDVRLYKSNKPVGVDNEHDLSYFLGMVILQRVRKGVDAASLMPTQALAWDELKDLKFELHKSELGLNACLVQSFEEMAGIVRGLNKNSDVSIELDGSRLRFLLNGRILHEDDVIDVPSRTGVSSRVQITMSALRVALMPINNALNAIITNFDNFRVSKPEPDGNAKLSLRDAFADVTNPVRGLRAKVVMDAAKNAASYEVGVVSGHGKERMFSVVEGAAAGKATGSKSFIASLAAPASNYKKEIVYGLCASLGTKIYIGSVLKMNEKELVALHTQMHKTMIGGFTLGAILDAPLPDKRQIRNAFGGEEFDF